MQLFVNSGMTASIVVDYKLVIYIYKYVNERHIDPVFDICT